VTLLASYSQTSFIIYLIALISLLSLFTLIGPYFIRKYYHKTKTTGTQDKKDYLLLIHGIAIIFLGVGRLILAIFDILTDFNSINYNLENFWIWKIGSSFQMFALCLFFVLMEKRLLKGRDKYILVIFYLFFWILGMMMLDVVIATNFIIIATILTVYIPFAYLYIAIISEGRVRKKASYVFIGFAIFMVAALLTGEIIIDLIAIPLGITRIDVHIIAYTIKIICLLFFFLGLK